MFDWLAESLRCTVFPADLGTEVPGFSVAMGAQPDRIEAQPKVGAQRETAVLADGATTVILERLPSVAHLRIGMAPDLRMVTGAELPALSAANESFLDRAATWLAALPPISRLAYGAVLVRPVVSRVEGYQALNELLPAVEVDPEGSEDFRLQINRPREITFGEETLRLNRLTKWSVRRVQVLVGNSPAAMTPTATEADYHVMLDMDVNTVPLAGVMLVPPSSLVDLFKTLVGLGVEISEKGDVP